MKLNQEVQMKRTRSSIPECSEMVSKPPSNSSTSMALQTSSGPTTSNYISSFTSLCLCTKSKSDYPYQKELSEPLKEPKAKAIIEAVEQSRETGDHAEIHKILTNKNINLSKKISIQY